MTQGHATRRRCAECGRFLSADLADGNCPACGAAISETTPQPSGLKAIPIEAPVGAVTAARGATARLSTSAVRPRGVVILRPSELHPDAPSPVALRSNLRSVERREPPAAVEIVPVPSPEAAVEPEPEPASRPLPGPVEKGAADWTLQLVVGVAIGILVGIAVPFLLTR